MKSNWLRGGTAPKIAKSGVTNGALTSAQRVRNILKEKDARTRRGIAAEIIGSVRREISESRENRRKAKEVRRAVDEAVNESVLEFPEAKMKIKRDKNGNVVIQRRNKGKFIAPLKVAAGFTLTEVMIVITGIFGLALTCALFYAAFHFISKYW